MRHEILVPDGGLGSLASLGRAPQWWACAIDVGMPRIAVERNKTMENHRLANSVFKKG